MEAEKQVKFFQGCVASAFAERDHSIMEVMTVIFLLSLSYFILLCKSFPAFNNYRSFYI